MPPQSEGGEALPVTELGQAIQRLAALADRVRALRLQLAGPAGAESASGAVTDRNAPGRAEQGDGAKDRTA